MPFTCTLSEFVIACAHPCHASYMVAKCSVTVDQKVPIASLVVYYSLKTLFYNHKLLPLQPLCDTRETAMTQLKPSLVLVHLFVCLQFLMNDSGGTSACLPDESQKSIKPTPDGSLEDTLRGLDHLDNCIFRLYLLSGVHVISSGVAVSAASVALSSHPNNTDRPVVRCGENMSHPGESVNETGEVGFLTWKGAREVSISGVDFEGCPRTVQFIEVDTVSIRNCTFRLVKCLNMATYS